MSKSHQNGYKMKLLIHLILLMTLTAQNLDRFKENVIFLSSDELRGRKYDSEGLQIAAKHVTDQFKQLGLEPLKNSSYQQQAVIDGMIVTNVVGMIPAEENSKKTIIFMAHLDGLGVGVANAENDSIYNGAMDNAVGVAAVIEFAAYFQQHRIHDVNLIFVTTSPEESGTQGSQHFLEQLSVPKRDILMVFNLDGFNVFGPTDDYSILPKSGVTYFKTLSNIITKNGYDVFVPRFTDFMNDKFDTKTFLSQGIPAVTIWHGQKLRGFSIEESKQRNVFGQRHHKPDDEVSDEWNWNGVTQHFQLILKMVNFYAATKKVEVVLDTSLFD